uniref:DNA topoisomerase 2 n=1 Tax=Pithovirus LCPAC001 TaxID=2506585 RepID=A0A481Z1P6_9VIRU|nr:MAG: DNA topoisomerase II [Pithovirus LCPAC001]
MPITKRLKIEELELEDLDERERVLFRPGMYIGSIKTFDRKYNIYDFKTKKVIKKDIKVSNGVERFFLEVISNTADNVIRSRQARIDPGIINIEVVGKKITVYNTGRPFVIKKYKQTDKYAPEIAFGKLGSSTNYKESLRTHVSGLNGMGIKLTNIYSKKFEVLIGDKTTKQQYHQVWTNNMLDCQKPTITPYKDHSFVKVTYELDFDRFDDNYKNGYSEDDIGLFAFHCINMCFTHKTKIKFNGTVFDSLDVISYINLINNTDVTLNRYITHTEWNKTKSVTKLDGIHKIPLRAVTDIEICIYDTPDHGKVISFVNGMITRKGGVHVNAIMEKIKNKVLKELNGTKLDNKFKLTLRDLKQHVSIVISCFVNKPDYEGQVKEYLNDPIPIIKMRDSDFSSMLKWDLAERLISAIQAKKYKLLSKTNGVKRNHLGDIGKAEDASYAGGKYSSRCVLYITEGLSAKNYALRLFKYMNGGKGRSGYEGVMPLKGKPKNAMKVKKDDIEKLNSNKEYIMLKKLLGLKDNTDYKNPRNRKGLRYGTVVILADSDVDGKHIVGLELTTFFAQFISLLEINYVKMFRTPIIRSFKGKQCRSFFTMGLYNQWKKKNLKGWRIKYFKGLASSNDGDVKRDVANMEKENNLVDLIYTPATRLAMETAFGFDSDVRKVWIGKYNHYEGIEKIKKLTIEDFINKEMIEHSITNNERTLPGMDGLKECQRKIMWTAIMKWKVSDYSLKSNRLVNMAINFTKYHYGPSSLIGAVNTMALNYTGTNNMEYFFQDGMFGTRNEGGKDAGADRYTSVGKMWWWSYVFKKDDDNITDFVHEEGKMCEPKTLFPIVPLFIINGSFGIGTGYSSFIPNYNPIDVLKWIKQKIEGKPTVKLIPWYRGFTGKIKVTVKIANRNENSPEIITKNILEPDILDYDQDSTIKRRMVITGNYEVDSDGVVTVSELPLGRYPSDYNNWLENKIQDGEIKDVFNGSDDKIIDFKIKGFKNPSYKNLKLIKTFGMTNMVVLNRKGVPQRFKTIESLMNYWYQWRFEHYQKRIDALIPGMENILKELDQKRRFILAVILGIEKGKIQGKSVVVVRENNQSIKDQMKQMLPLEIDYNVYKTTKLSSCSEKGLSKISFEEGKIRQELEKIKNTTPGKLWLKELKDFEHQYKINIKKNINKT